MLASSRLCHLPIAFEGLPNPLLAVMATLPPVPGFCCCLCAMSVPGCYLLPRVSRYVGHSSRQCIRSQM